MSHYTVIFPDATMHAFALIAILHKYHPFHVLAITSKMLARADALYRIPSLPSCLVLSSMASFFPLMGSIILVNQLGTLSKFPEIGMLLPYFKVDWGLLGG